MLPPILKRINKHGYLIFTNGDYNLNIFGIRSAVKESKKFNDFLGVCYKENGAWICRFWQGTTDPGVYYLENKNNWLNPAGVAVLAPGQYKSAYSIGKHGKYEALVQTDVVSVFRDGNLDSKIDSEPSSLQTGEFGINIHASSSSPYTGATDRSYGSIGAWSAGCQVFARDQDFREFMKLVKKSQALWGDKFTYTLLANKHGNDND